MSVAHDALRIGRAGHVRRGAAGLLAQGKPFNGCKIIGVALLMTSLAVSLVGSLPVMASIHLTCPEEIKAIRQHGVTIKTNLLKVSSFLLFWAFGMFLLGFVFH